MTTVMIIGIMVALIAVRILSGVFRFKVDESHLFGLGGSFFAHGLLVRSATFVFFLGGTL